MTHPLKRFAALAVLGAVAAIVMGFAATPALAASKAKWSGSQLPS